MNIGGQFVSDVLDIHWKPSEAAIANSVGGEMVILHLDNGNYYGLDSVGSLLWEGLLEGQTPNDIGAVILEKYDIDRDTVESDLRRFLTELTEHGLVEKQIGRAHV